MSKAFTPILQPVIGRIFCSVLAIILSIGLGTAPASAQDYLPLVGGEGGGQFDHLCPDNQNLGGVELRVADDVDAIRPICVSTYAPTERSTPVLTTGTGLVGPNSLVPGWHGGTGGHIIALLCPAKMPVVLGVDLGAEGQNTFIVNNVHLFCGKAIADYQALGDEPAAKFDGPGYTISPKFVGLGFIGGDDHSVRTTERCPSGEVAIGIHGRSGVWLDATGLICGPVRIDTSRKPSVALGRAGSGNTTTSSLTICEAAAVAKNRNSPAAASLERQCQATKTPLPAVSGAAKLTTPMLPGLPKPAPAKPGIPPICQLAEEARAHGLPHGAFDIQCADALKDSGGAK